MLTAADLGSGHGYAKSEDGFELHMATNYLGPFLLTMLLLPSLQRSGTPVSAALQPMSAHATSRVDQTKSLAAF